MARRHSNREIVDALRRFEALRPLLLQEKKSANSGMQKVVVFLVISSNILASDTVSGLSG